MHYSSLEPVFAADPLLLYDFIYICPESEYTVLFSRLPGFLSLMWLSFKQVPLIQEPVSCCVSVRQVNVVSMYFPQLLKWKPWLEEIKKKISNEIPEYVEILQTDICIYIFSLGHRF